MTEALLALIIDLSIAGAFFLIWFLYKQSKTPETAEKTKTAEAQTTPAPEKQFPVWTHAVKIGLDFFSISKPPPYPPLSLV